MFANILLLLLMLLLLMLSIHPLQKEDDAQKKVIHYVLCRVTCEFGVRFGKRDCFVLLILLSQLLHEFYASIPLQLCFINHL